MRRRPAARKARAGASRPAASEYPLGMGVADGFALDRLAAPSRMKRAAKVEMREIGWAAFGELARELSARIAQRFRPDVVIGLAKGGVFAGGAIAAGLGAEFFPVRLEARRRDPAPLEASPAAALPDLSGKKVLVVDDVAATGGTLTRARTLARKAGAREVKTAVLVVRKGGGTPDWHALATDELILFGWDYQLDQSSAAPIDPGEVGV